MRLIIKIMFFILALTIKANTPTIIQQTEQKYAIEDSIVSIYELEIYNATNDSVLWLWIAPNLKAEGDTCELIKQYFFDNNTRLINVAVDVDVSEIIPTLGKNFITRISPKGKFSFVSKEKSKLDNIIPYIVILSQNEIILRYPKLKAIIQPPIIFYEKPYLFL